VSLERGELGRIRKEAPDRFARRRDRLSQRWVTVLQERHHLEEKTIVPFPKLAEGGRSGPPLVEGPALSQQVIDLILAGGLGDHADGLGVSESLLQRYQVQGWRHLLLPRGW